MSIRGQNAEMNAIHMTTASRGSRRARSAASPVRLMVLAPLFLGACMMSGLGGMGMHGSGGMQASSPSASMRDPATMKEVEAQGIRLTVNFPAYAAGHPLAYEASIRNVRDETLIRDASVFLVVTPDGESKVAPSMSDSGTYVFRPALTTERASRLVVRVERVGPTALDPPVQVEHIVRVENRVGHRATGDPMTTSVTPVVMIGAAAMAVMMLLVFR